MGVNYELNTDAHMHLYVNIGLEIIISLLSLNDMLKSTVFICRITTPNILLIHFEVKNLYKFWIFDYKLFGKEQLNRWRLGKK